MAGSKLKNLLLLVISLLFTASGFFASDEILWFPTLFFGTCSILFIVQFFVKKTASPVLADDELFFKVYGTGFLEYYDWGFHDVNAGKKFYWDEIVNIIAHKIEWVTEDEIRITCAFSDGVDYILSEDTSGWNQFIKHLENNLSLNEGWLGKL